MRTILEELKKQLQMKRRELNLLRDKYRKADSENLESLIIHSQDIMVCATEIRCLANLYSKVTEGEQ